MIPKLSHRNFKRNFEAKIEKKGLKDKKEKILFAIAQLLAFGAKMAPVPAVLDSMESMSLSKASDAIGEENFALCNVKDMLNLIDYNSINDQQLASDYFEALVTATSRIYYFGLMYEGTRYSISHFSASGRGKGEGIFVTHRNEAAIMYLVSHYEAEFVGQTVTAWWKVKMNVASHQQRISEIAAAVGDVDTSKVKIGMKNILFVRGLHLHHFHVNDVRKIDWTTEGSAAYAEVSNPVDDGAGWIDRDAVEALFGVRLELADLQGRGWDIKYTLEISEIFRVLASELGGWDKYIENALTGELVPVKDLVKRGYCVLLPIENIKYRDIVKNPGKYPNYPNGLADDELWICASVSDKDDLKMHIRDSRQMLVPLQGATKTEIEHLINTERIDKLQSTNEYEAFDEFIEGFSTSTAVKKRRQDVYRAERHELEFGRFEENGCYPFCCWEALPQLAHLLVLNEKVDLSGMSEKEAAEYVAEYGPYVHALDYRDFRSLRGLKVLIGCVPTKTVMISRFPNIERHFIFCKNMSNFSSSGNHWLEVEKSLHSRNTLVIGIDVPGRDVLKLDCDGDTPKVEYPKNKEEDDLILNSYDWDMLFVPTARTARNVSWEEFVTIQAAEKTVSAATMQRLAKLNAAQ